MAQVIPFRGIRYSKEKTGDLTAVVTQPYDRIGEAEQETYYTRNRYNIVRIIKGRERADDNGENVYRRAADFLTDWMKKGILRRDELPALYPYHQEYTIGGEHLIRKGVIALGRLQPDRVHAHENTLKGPKEDRLRLLRATEANFGHIFMLYSDPSRRADQALQASTSDVEPEIEVKDDYGNRHLLWRATDPEVIAQVQAALADKDLYIADGHHRYETAVNFMRECMKKGWKQAAPETFDVRMMTLFNIDEPGMTIRPIHRLIHGVPNFDPERFLARLEKDFQITRHSSLTEMQQTVIAGKDVHSFGCYTNVGFVSLSLRDEGLMDQLISGGWSSDWRRLDVSILHTAILERALGIDAKALAEQRNVTYTRDPEAAIRKVNQGKEQILFLL
ncbi:MAG: DUF1015 domain-containing protein, partial [Candidatus Bipolaricaulota bacterium]|nr:DUF1015 domain-containing protein [Candidatus Bipolaricaulota bacterium]